MKKVILCNNTCLELEMNGKHGEMRRCARQTQLVVQCLEASATINRAEVLNKQLISDLLEKLVDNREGLRDGFDKAVDSGVLPLRMFCVAVTYVFRKCVKNAFVQRTPLRYPPKYGQKHT